MSKEGNQTEIVIPDEILQATRMSVDEVKQELAVLLFQKDKITLGQASRYSRLSRCAKELTDD